jgi:hypothetical protein
MLVTEANNWRAYNLDHGFSIVLMDYESAKEKLRKAGQPGRLIRVGDDWDIEALPERAIFLQDQKKQREIRKHLEKIKGEELEAARIKSIEKGKRVIEESRHKESEILRREALIMEAWRVARSFDDQLIDIEQPWSMPLEDKQWHSDEGVKDVLLKRYGENTEILMQYRHAGSNSEEGNEWGLWIVRRDQKYVAYHESIDRQAYGGKSKEKELQSRAEAISYAAWHIQRDWYSDERFISPEVDNHDFPKKSPPSSDEREKARMRFKRWKDVAAEGEANGDIDAVSNP